MDANFHKIISTTYLDYIAPLLRTLILQCLQIATFTCCMVQRLPIWNIKDKFCISEYGLTETLCDYL